MKEENRCPQITRPWIRECSPDEGLLAFALDKLSPKYGVGGVKFFVSPSNGVGSRPAKAEKHQNTKTPKRIMGIGEGVSRTSDGYLENENYLQVRKNDKHESGYDPMRVRQVRDMLPRLYAPHSLESRQHSGPRANRTSRKNGSHRLPAIALTRIIPSPYHPSRGFGVPSSPLG